MSQKKYDVAFEGYYGSKRYSVSHPDYETVLKVAAPSEVTAIVAAAKKWKVRWQTYEFYAYCEVECINKKKGTEE